LMVNLNCPFVSIDFHHILILRGSSTGVGLSQYYARKIFE